MAPVRDFELSTIDQVVDRNYTTALWWFRLPRHADIHEIFSQMQRAMSLTATEVPVIAGRLKPAGDPKMGFVKIVVDERIGVPVTMSNFSRQAGGQPHKWRHGSFDELVRRKFPPEAINDPILRPVSLDQYGPYAPVFLMHMNFIDGGLIFFDAFSHSWADATSAMQIHLRLSRHFAAISTGQQSKIHPLPSSSFDRKRLSEAPEMELPIPLEALGEPVEEPPADPDEENPWVFSIFFITARAMADLKKYAAPKTEGAYISTSDAINALLWRSFAKAQGLENDEDVSMKAAMAVDFRTRLDPPMPMTYVGNAATVIDLHADAEDLLAPGQEGLANLALKLRETLKEWDANSEVETMVGLLNSTRQLTSGQRANARALYGGPDLLFADHTKIPVYHWEWGSLGKLVLLREMPQIGSAKPTCAVINVCPPTRDGSCEIKTTLMPETVQKMMADPDIQQWIELRDAGAYEDGRPAFDTAPSSKL